MSLATHSVCMELCPRTPDRVAPAMPSVLEHTEIPTAPMGSPCVARSCGTPSRQLPMKSPASGNAPLTGRSTRRASAGGVATPLRASRRHSFAGLPEELNAPTPRALILCDCGHCPMCLAVSETIYGVHRTVAIATSPRKCEQVRLGDLASPGPSSPGQSPLECAIPEALPSVELVQEIPVCRDMFTSACLPCDGVRDPRKQRQQVLLPFLVIPTSTSCANMGKVDDPRIGQQPVVSGSELLPESMPLLNLNSITSGHCQGSASLHPVDPRRRRRRLAKDLGPERLSMATPCKRRLSPAQEPELELEQAIMPGLAVQRQPPAAPKCPRSPTHPASCRARRYRSPTPGPACSRPQSKGSRYRSPTPGPSRCKQSDASGYANSSMRGISP